MHILLGNSIPWTYKHPILIMLFSSVKIIRGIIFEAGQEQWWIATQRFWCIETRCSSEIAQDVRKDCFSNCAAMLRIDPGMQLRELRQIERSSRSSIISERIQWNQCWSTDAQEQWSESSPDSVRSSISKELCKMATVTQPHSPFAPSVIDISRVPSDHS